NPCPSLTIENYVPKNNFYRRLKSILELNFVYEAVKPFYGKCGQKSIDPVVFFKLLLVGHFENICSDRALIVSSQLRLDILYFLDFKLGERLPCHSTISRTRKRLPVVLFEKLFEKVLNACIDAGMVGGQSQAIDGAFVEANASLDKLESKLVLQWKLLPGEVLADDPSTTASQAIA
ncbi:transposase, partial [Rhodocytophaga aerolata]|uniref:transposase n=1 Tax=Rhodocytophaga aerolata TaxID=455078 RepID=UPI003617CDB2